MKFESKFGLGEICVYNEDQFRGNSINNRRMTDLLVKVVAVTFDMDGNATYTVELANDKIGIQRINVHEASLTGDPAFDQETGSYSTEDS